MTRHYEMQDPNDRSPNSPAVIASATRVLALYNQSPDNERMVNITQKVKEWFHAEALASGWDHAEFAGNECLLRKNF